MVATPHLGAATREAQLKVALGTAHEVLAALAGEPVQTAVNAPVAPQGMAETLLPYVALAQRSNHAVMIPPGATGPSPQRRR